MYSHRIQHISEAKKNIRKKEVKYPAILPKNKDKIKEYEKKENKMNYAYSIRPEEYYTEE